jgi:hypothetical protein
MRWSDVTRTYTTPQTLEIRTHLQRTLRNPSFMANDNLSKKSEPGGLSVHGISGIRARASRASADEVAVNFAIPGSPEVDCFGSK